jgi:hypothetical protein
MSYRMTDAEGRPVAVARGGAGLSPSPIGAYVETLGRLGTISGEDPAERSLSELALSRALILADLTDRLILGRDGIAGDISTDYRPSSNSPRPSTTSGSTASTTQHVTTPTSAKEASPSSAGRATTSS